jgi:hypothetical protein
MHGIVTVWSVSNRAQWSALPHQHAWANEHVSEVKVTRVNVIAVVKPDAMTCRHQASESDTPTRGCSRLDTRWYPPLLGSPAITDMHRGVGRAIGVQEIDAEVIWPLRI